MLKSAQGRILEADTLAKVSLVKATYILCNYMHHDGDHQNAKTDGEDEENGEERVLHNFTYL